MAIVFGPILLLLLAGMMQSRRDWKQVEKYRQDPYAAIQRSREWYEMTPQQRKEATDRAWSIPE
jgi:hypothetical protein